MRHSPKKTPDGGRWAVLCWIYRARSLGKASFSSLFLVDIESNEIYGFLHGVIFWRLLSSLPCATCGSVPVELAREIRNSATPPTRSFKG